MGCGSSTEGSEPKSKSVKDNDKQEGKHHDKKLDKQEDKHEDKQSDAGSDIADNPFGYLENVALFAHNHFRDLHQSRPLKLSRDLCEIADRLAKRMARSEELDNSPPEDRMYKGEPCGENLYWKDDPSVPVSGDEAVKSWYTENEHYDYSDKLVRKAAHFTQLVWANTCEVGVASASSANGTAVIAVYYPTGNVEGQFEENVKQKVQRNEVANSCTVQL